jgi:soluble lytic murein transglycosylase-like protein
MLKIGWRWTLAAIAAAGFLAGSSSSLAGSLSLDPGGADPLLTLNSEQKRSARALGEARRHIDAGRLAEARFCLARIQGLESLGGYVDLVRVRLFMSEGAHAKAYEEATAALKRCDSEAPCAALGVLQGEALAMGGDAKAAELAWQGVLKTAVGAPGSEDDGVRQSVELLIVASRQRTGSLDPAADPLVLLDQNYEEISVASPKVPLHLLSPSAMIEQAEAALDAGHPEEAHRLYDRLISKKLDSGQRRRAQMGRARSFFRKRKYESASKAYAELLPDLKARFWMARSLARSGRVEASLEEFAKVAKVAEGKDAELASWALYLKGTLHEDRGEMAQAIDAFDRAATYRGYPSRVRSALWRKGWAEYGTAAYPSARKTFEDLIALSEEDLGELRPRYWAARAAILSGKPKVGRKELAGIARAFPLTYYGWRSQERLALTGAALVMTQRELTEGTRRVDDESIERAALLIEAGLEDLARDELRFAARDARGFADRTRVGILLARVGDYHGANALVVTAYADSLARGIQAGRESLWWLSWPPAYRTTISEVFPKEASIEPELVLAIMREESHYRVDARSSVGALGLLQLMPKTAAELAKKKGIEGFELTDLFDARTNITLGAAYLDQLARRFDGRMSAAIGSYNAGPSRVSQWLTADAKKLDDDVWVENIPYDQTRAYVKRVMRSLHAYKSFYR